MRARIQGKSLTSQSGIAVILVVTVIAIVAALWISSKHGTIIGNFKSKEIESEFIELKQAKDRLMQFALLTPELYHLQSLSGFDEPIIGPGYFPCPDGAVGGSVTEPVATDGIADWDTCSTGADPVGSIVGDANMLLWGYLPRIASNTSLGNLFAFGAERKLLYFVDRRFVLPSKDYGDNESLPATNATSVIDETGRFAPLTPQTIAIGGSGSLTLNGATGIVAILVDPGSDNKLNEVTRVDGNFFYSIPNSSITSEDPTIDKLVVLTYEQNWLPLVARRVCRERARFTRNYAGYIDNDNADSDNDETTDIDPIYQGYSVDLSLDVDPVDGVINVDDWKYAQNWFFWEGNPNSWYEWSAVCP
ncbi:hypothetical protein J3998_05145 [Thiomicrorhabdus sp. 6S2-11]|uniref:Type 4 fimbrial biogenesis protein PilX N-terminal domain-containing protein n=1 Tax=Thiomicrorhabdus marina TaxID=2818442 RepID=A0ABS3Q3N7_9GAMM|nr:hypothetical protein [Thiomicrorhabdus marina]MBO1926955.1 hypothetical protein [Thiomicrorhabdus marina]